MSPTEAAQLLSILAAVDRREFDAPTAKAWAWALTDVPAERCEEAARRAMREGVYVDVAAIRTQLRRMQPALERDVRSAKARGLIATDWPTRTPLPIDIERSLRTLQSADWERTNDTPAEITAMTRDGAHSLSGAA